jgi:hypothetical protein
MCPSQHARLIPLCSYFNKNRVWHSQTNLSRKLSCVALTSVISRCARPQSGRAQRDRALISASRSLATLLSKWRIVIGRSHFLCKVILLVQSNKAKSVIFAITLWLHCQTLSGLQKAGRTRNLKNQGIWKIKEFEKSRVYNRDNDYSISKVAHGVIKGSWLDGHFAKPKSASYFTSGDSIKPQWFSGQLPIV